MQEMTAVVEPIPETREALGELSNGVDTDVEDAFLGMSGRPSGPCLNPAG
jgi:hypothetical protein